MPRARTYASAEEAHLIRYSCPSFRANHMLNNARARAKGKGLELSLTKEWLVAGLNLGKCAVTGIEFDLSVKLRGSGRITPWSPSLDRIDSTKGYTPENCRLVVWMYNAAKHISTDGDVLRLAKAVCNPE